MLIRTGRAGRICAARDLLALGLVLYKEQKEGRNTGNMARLSHATTRANMIAILKCALHMVDLPSFSVFLCFGPAVGLSVGFALPDCDFI